jgi:hypothetical protein
MATTHVTISKEALDLILSALERVSAATKKIPDCMKRGRAIVDGQRPAPIVKEAWLEEVDAYLATCDEQQADIERGLARLRGVLGH